MLKKTSPIGIFDSGIGGLTVVKEIIRQLPNEDIVYFGDTARLPYGNKSPQTVIKFSLENARFLLRFGVKFIIVACNTSSSLALSALRRNCSVPILGVIEPAVEKAVQVSARRRIGIVGTRATIASQAYQRQIKRLDSRIKSFALPCPLFVPLAEEGWTNDEVTLKVARRYLTPLLKKDIDTLILGCTHYPLLKNIIKKAVGKNIEFVDSAKETAHQAKRLLLRYDLCANHRDRLAKCRFYVSDAPDTFQALGRRFLGKTVKDVKKA